MPGAAIRNLQHFKGIGENQPRQPTGEPQIAGADGAIGNAAGGFAIFFGRTGEQHLTQGQSTLLCRLNHKPHRHLIGSGYRFARSPRHRNQFLRARRTARHVKEDQRIRGQDIRFAVCHPINVGFEETIGSHRNLLPKGIH